MKRYGIQHFAIKSVQHTAAVERFKRTIKPMIWTYLSDRGTVRWVNIVKDLVDVYNNSRNRFIGTALTDVQ